MSTGKELVAAAKEDAWEWTEEREKCLDRYLAGWPKKQIADDLAVHRNTIANWCAHPSFLARVEEHNKDHQATTRQRRVRETTMMTDKVAKLATKALDQAAERPDDDRSVRKAKEWLGEYREFREQERIDSGENVQHHQHQVSGAVVHGIVTSGSFKGFLEEALADGIIDVEALEVSNPHDLVVAMTQKALLDTDILDRMTDEDEEIKQGATLPMADRKESK